MIDELINDQAEKICALYKIDLDEAKNFLQVEIDKRADLKEKWSETNNLKNIYRTSDFKQFIKKIRKEIYYKLRTYQTGSEPLSASDNKSGDDTKTGVEGSNMSSLADSHISTKERAPYVEEFYEQLHELLSKSQYIVDLGGGLFPLTFPFSKYPGIKKYVWIDKDKRSYETIQNNLNKLPQGVVDLHCESIGAKDWKKYLPEGAKKFELAFMLKLVPVIYRQERDLLTSLKNVPADYFLVTGSKEAMAKKIDIEKREDRIVNSFIQTTGKTVVQKFDIENEFGYILK